MPPNGCRQQASSPNCRRPCMATARRRHAGLLLQFPSPGFQRPADPPVRGDGRRAGRFRSRAGEAFRRLPCTTSGRSMASACRVWARCPASCSSTRPRRRLPLRPSPPCGARRRRACSLWPDRDVPRCHGATGARQRLAPGRPRVGALHGLQALGRAHSPCFSSASPANGAPRPVYRVETPAVPARGCSLVRTAALATVSDLVQLLANCGKLGLEAIDRTIKRRRRSPGHRAVPLRRGLPVEPRELGPTRSCRDRAGADGGDTRRARP